MKTEIALVNSMEKLAAAPDFGRSKEIEIIIAVKEEGGTTPRNFSLDYETPKASTGGSYARIFASGSATDPRNLFSYYGPNVSFGKMEDYEHGLRSYKRVKAKLQKMHVLRGSCADAAEEMGRWLEACGVKEVFMRPVGYRPNGSDWLNEGEWTVLTVGQLVDMVRRNLYTGEQAAAATA